MLAGKKVVRGGPDPKSPKEVPCFCKRPPLNIPIPGIPVGFWEPVRLVDVTRTPFCLVSMGGLCLGGGGTQGQGDIEENPDDGTHHSFYQVHWYTYPVMTALEILVDFACLESLSIDLAYLTELDPLWNDDEKSGILNPEGILFGNLIAQAACVVDCIEATRHLPKNDLFWCGGCQGSLYPFTGTVTEHMGGVQASLLLTQRMMAKLPPRIFALEHLWKRKPLR